jgi:hypothetical protein
MYTKFWSENLKVRNYLEDNGVDGRIMIECYLKKISSYSCRGLLDQGHGVVMR